MRKLLPILIFLVIPVIQATGQTETVTGQVSFNSLQHTYVRFRSTAGISEGDTLYISVEEVRKPVLLVQSTSSTSCLCIRISKEELPEGHIIIAVIPGIEPEKNNSQKEIIEENQEVRNETVPAPSSGMPKTKSLEGSISAASYSHFTNDGGSNQRFRYRLSGNATNISGSKFSARTYMSYVHRAAKKGTDTWFSNDGLKVYDLWLKYDIDSSSHIKLGRQINPKMAGMGSFDGLTAEKSFTRLSAGLTAGSAPGYEDYGFDPGLFQLGGYLAYDVTGKISSSSTSVAFMQHLSSGRTGRRYIYLQQSAAAGRKVMFLGSVEADLSDQENKINSFTSGYLHLTWRASRVFSLNGSYDARRNPVWFETYRTTLDSLIENELRQTLRIGTDVRINHSLNTGFRSSVRFVPDDDRKTLNLSGFATWKSSGRLNLTATISGNYLQTSFINGFNAGITFRKSSERLQAGAGYNFYDYTLNENVQHTLRHTGHIDLYWQFLPGTSLMADYELSYEGNNILHQLFFQLAKRF